MTDDSTLYDKFLTALAELIGTAILVFIGCTALVGSMGESPKQFQVAFAFGIAIMISIQVRFIRQPTSVISFCLIDISFQELKKNIYFLHYTLYKR